MHVGGGLGEGRLVVCEPGIFKNISEWGVRTFGAGPCQSASAAEGGRGRGNRTRKGLGMEEEVVGQEDE